jgi:NAD(P)-dependent dehydrogenase (short-subunit alcohol dehydrogenase family)
MFLPQTDCASDAGAALALGFARVIQQEFPNIAVRCIDFSSQQVNPERENRQLLSELCAPGSEAEIAYRGEDRWVCEQKPIVPDHRQPPGRFEFREGAYIIFGGTGHVGLCFADFLSTVAGASVMLVGRRELPRAEEWDSRLADGTLSAPDRVLLERLQAFRRRGNRMEYRRGDLQDRTTVDAILRDASDRFGRLRGVIHAAGVVDQDHLRFIADTTSEMSKRIFSPHYLGTEVLCEAVRHFDVDFCVTCSSLSSLVGGLSYGAHAAGHRAMDSAVINASTAAAHTRWLTVNYDTWLVPSRAAGLGSGASDLHILPSEGVEVLRLALTSGERQVYVSTVPLAERIAGLRNVFGGLGRVSGPDTDAEDGTAPGRLDEPGVREMVLSTFRSVLGDQDLAPDDNFFARGGSSLAMLDAIARINRLAKTAIPLSEGFQSLSASAMSGLAWRELASRPAREMVPS